MRDFRPAASRSKDLDQASQHGNKPPRAESVTQRAHLERSAIILQANSECLLGLHCKTHDKHATRSGAPHRYRTLFKELAARTKPNSPSQALSLCYLQILVDTRIRLWNAPLKSRRRYCSSACAVLWVSLSALEKGYGDRLQTRWVCIPRGRRGASRGCCGNDPHAHHGPAGDRSMSRCRPFCSETPNSKNHGTSPRTWGPRLARPSSRRRSPSKPAS
mmetsp:Transcript_126576/g.319696  ORF Transcript_126576/g.319696 Transcript_126576/m.319696 type:complete len:218 (+) Transcript_126576:52-705(+)